jgi:hypothetical protein
LSENPITRNMMQSATLLGCEVWNRNLRVVEWAIERSKSSAHFRVVTCLLPWRIWSAKHFSGAPSFLFDILLSFVINYNIQCLNCRGAGKTDLVYFRWAKACV